VQLRQLTPDGHDEPCTSGGLRLTITDSHGSLTGSYRGFQGYCESLVDSTRYDVVTVPDGSLSGHSVRGVADSVLLKLTLGTTPLGYLRGVLKDSAMAGSAVLSLQRSTGDPVPVTGLWRGFR